MDEIHEFMTNAETRTGAMEALRKGGAFGEEDKKIFQAMSEAYCARFLKGDSVPSWEDVKDLEVVSPYYEETPVLRRRVSSGTTGLLDRD